jgi:hypothetical protein
MVITQVIHVCEGYDEDKGENDVPVPLLNPIKKSVVPKEKYVSIILLVPFFK